MQNDDIEALLVNCTIVKGYPGIQEIYSLAKSDPQSTFQAIWKRLTAVEDPGRDDGTLCYELLILAASTVGREVVEEQMLKEWDQLPSGIHRNLLNGFGSSQVVSIETVVRLFDSPNTEVRQRHLIVAILVRGNRLSEAPERILALGKRIGAYDEEYSQRILDSFMRSLVRSVDAITGNQMTPPTL